MRAAWAGLVILGTLFAGCSDDDGGYPKAYLLFAEDLPEGTKLAEVDSSLQQFGIDSNPDEFPVAYARGYMGEYQQYAPDVAWGEFIQRVDERGGFGILSLFWNDESKIDAGLAELKKTSGGQFCSYGRSEDGAGRILRDGPVVVLLGGGDDGMREYVPALTAKLQAKAPGLRDVC